MENPEENRQPAPRSRFFKNKRRVGVLVTAVAVLAGVAGVRAVQVASCDPLLSSCPSFFNVSQTPSPKASGSDKAANQQAVSEIKTTAMTGNCKLDAKLASPCRPLIGATSNNYPGISGWKNSVQYLEKRAGRQLDIVHSYHSPTQTSINKDEKAFIDRANTLLYMNWKPDAKWGPAGGSNSTVNKRIDQMAASIKALGNKKIYLAIYHEPENDISPGGSKCSGAKGNKGTTQEYREMWRNVRKRFDAQGVKNVVWVMNYMGWQGWDCAVKDLWPGNDLVDWITWDPYTNDKSTFKKDMTRFYDFLAANTDAKHAFTSKNWGIGEMGYEGEDQKKAYKYYDDMLATVKKNELPRLKMYLFFDMNAAGFGGPKDWDARIGYAKSGKVDPTEQKHFNAMFNGIAPLDKPQTPTKPSPADPTKPAQPTTPTKPGQSGQPSGGGGAASGPIAPITVRGLASGATVSGVVNLSGVTHTSARVQVVTMRVDGKWIASDTSAPYAFALDTRKLSAGKHTLILRVQAGGKKYDSRAISFTVNNKPVSNDPVTVHGITNGATLRGKVGITGSTRPGDSVKLVTLRVDGKWIATDENAPWKFTLDTRKLRNGKHTLLLRAWIRGAGYDSRTYTINVRN